MPSARASRVQQGLTLSLAMHALLLLAIGLLLGDHMTPPVPIEPSVALVFAPPSPPTETPAVEPTPPPPQPVVQAAPEAADPFAHAPPPQYTEPARAPPRHVAPVPSPQSTHTVEAPVQQTAVVAPAAITLARPVAGMESDRPPVYPEMARRRGQQGRVVVRVEVSADGRPVSVSIEQGSGFASLDDAALSAVQKWSFIPATRDGAPVPAVADVPVRFRLID